jgi:hypothetical protein
MELRIASDRDLVNCYKSLQKLNEDCEKLRAQLKELEEATLPITRLLVPHPGGPKIAPLVERRRYAEDALVRVELPAVLAQGCESLFKIVDEGTEFSGLDDAILGPPG